MRIPVDLLIFDFDGTLADSLPPAVEAIQEMQAKLGYRKMTPREINDHIGFGEISLVAGSIGTNDSEKIKEAQKTYYDIYTQKLKKIKLYPHVNEIIEFFKNKIKLVVSNKRDEFIRIILGDHGLLDSFAEILGGDTSPCLKPDPCVINHVLEKYKIAKERALFIGDMTVDIETGKNAGIKTCAATYGFHSRAKLEALKPDFLINDILELKGLIDD